MVDKKDEDNTEEIIFREDLLSTAVNFLLNPDVKKRSDESKIEFLKKKGLTDEEISEALQRANLHHEGSPVSSDQLSRYYPVQHPPLPYRKDSVWSRLSGFSSSLIVFGVAIYGVHHLYKKFIRPLLFDELSEENYTPSHIKQITENIAAMKSTLLNLQLAVAQQNDEINKLLRVEGVNYTPTPVILEDLKRDVNSLKSILISRHQFPAVPQIQSAKATIPSWQLVPEKTESTDKEPEELNTTVTLKPEDSNVVPSHESNLNGESVKKEDGASLLNNDSQPSCS